MKKMLSYCTLALLILGCAQQTFTVPKQTGSSSTKETITHLFLRFLELGREENCRCDQNLWQRENVVKTETQQTFVNGLLGFITLGIYTPLEARVYCSQ